MSLLKNDRAGLITDHFFRNSMKSRLQGACMIEKSKRYETQPIEQMIMTIRGLRVILDADLASIYGVPTRRLKEIMAAINGK